ncbi:hypothetical protein HispidOSU_008616 [Sigmodon hispidus]
MDLVYGLVWLLTVLLEGISGQGVYDLFSRSLEVVFQHANLNHQPKHYLGTCK